MSVRTTNRRVFSFASALAFALALTVLSVPESSLAAQNCGTSNGFNICLNAPDGVLSGDVAISVTVSGSASGIAEMRFSWGTSTSSSARLLSDFEAPWNFTWRTDRYLDGTRYLNVRVERFDGSVGAPVWLQLTLENGNDAAVPSNPNDWRSLWQPRSFSGDPVIAAAGDGGDGTARSDAVAQQVSNSNAEILLYLGDLYERGTPAEFDHNFGRAAFDDPGGGWGWGRLAAFTRPTLGNHENANRATWRDYWHGRPDYESFVHGGVRFFNLNSECTAVGGCGVGSPQYNFVQNTLASNTHSCVVAYWHRAVLGAVDPDNTTMRPIWQLLADNGGDLVLSGHIHTMEYYVPLDGDLQAGQPDSHMVEIVAGAGGHGLVSKADTDPRTDWQATKVAGVAYITAFGGDTGEATRLDWVFRDINGSPVMNGLGEVGEGSVDCGGGGTPDTTPPSVPTNVAGQSTAPGSIDVTWSAAADDLSSSITYRVYRDGDPTPVGQVTSTSTTTASWTDTGLAGGSSHTYEVDAVDEAGNASERSVPSPPITVMAGDPVVFSDDFSSGFANWSNVTNLTLDGSQGGAAAPSARAAVSGARAYATHDLSATYSTLCVREAINISSLGASSVALLKLRTAADQSVGRVFVESNRALKVRADVSGQIFPSGVALPTGWSTIELCATIGSSGTLTLLLNGSQLGAWTSDLGASQIGRIQILDDAAKTFTANVDDVVADLTAG